MNLGKYCQQNSMHCGATNQCSYAASGLISIKQCSISSSIASSQLAVAQNRIWKGPDQEKGNSACGAANENAWLADGGTGGDFHHTAAARG